MVKAKTADVEFKHRGEDRTQLIINANGLEIVADLDPDQVDDSIVELQQCSERNEEHYMRRHRDEYGDAERMWRQ